MRVVCKQEVTFFLHLLRFINYDIMQTPFSNAFLSVNI